MINKTSLTGFLISLVLGASLYAQGQDRGGRGNDYGRMPTLALERMCPNIRMILFWEDPPIIPLS